MGQAELLLGDCLQLGPTWNQHTLFVPQIESAYAGFRVIELHTASQSSLGEKAELGDNQLIELGDSVSNMAQRNIGGQNTLLWGRDAYWMGMGSRQLLVAAGKRA